MKRPDKPTITNLTDNKWAALEAHAKEWTAPERTGRPEEDKGPAKAAMAALYEATGNGTPIFLHMASPLACALAKGVLRWEAQRSAILADDWDAVERDVLRRINVFLGGGQWNERPGIYNYHHDPDLKASRKTQHVLDIWPRMGWREIWESLPEETRNNLRAFDYDTNLMHHISPSDTQALGQVVFDRDYGSSWDGIWAGFKDSIIAALDADPKLGAMLSKSGDALDELSETKPGHFSGHGTPDVYFGVRHHVTPEIWDRSFGFYIEGYYANLGQHIEKAINLALFTGTFGFEVVPLYERQTIISVLAQAVGFEQLGLLQISDTSRAIVYALVQTTRDVFWASTFPGVALISDHPVDIVRDGTGLPHNNRGPAITFADGWAPYFWHGVSMPGYTIEAPDRISAINVLYETNAERRRCLIEMTGYERFLETADAVLLDESKLGRLWRVALHSPSLLPDHIANPDHESRFVTILEVKNSTAEPDGSRKTYFLSVHPELCPIPDREAGEIDFGPPQELTVRNAIASTFGMTGAQYNLFKET